MMKSKAIILALPLLGACSEDTVERWAFDPIYVERDGENLTGFLTWELFSRRWQKRQSGKFYLCSVVVELQGEQTSDDLCTGCTDAWDISSEIIDSDCSSATQELPLFESVTKLAIGAVPDEIQASSPMEGINAGSYLSYDNGDWQPHGWALDPDGESPWTGGDTLNLWPAFTWDLDSL